MEKAISVWDVLKAFEPTGFSSDGTSVVLGMLAAIFVSTLVSLFFYMLRSHILPTWQRVFGKPLPLGFQRQPDSTDDRPPFGQYDGCDRSVAPGGWDSTEDHS